MGADLTSTLGEMPDPVALEAEADKLERKARALRQIAEGFKALNGDAAALVFGTRIPSGWLIAGGAAIGLAYRLLA